MNPNGKNDLDPIKKLQSQHHNRQSVRQTLIHDLENTVPHASPNFESELESRLMQEFSTYEGHQQREQKMTQSKTMAYPSHQLNSAKRSLPLTLVATLSLLLLGITVIIALNTFPKNGHPYGARAQVNALQVTLERIADCTVTSVWQEVHTVQSGETLYSIAEQYDIPAENINSLLDANCLPSDPQLAVGDILLIPANNTNMLAITGENEATVYESPDASSDNITVLNPNTLVEIMDATGTPPDLWYEVQVDNGLIGWVQLQDLLITQYSPEFLMRSNRSDAWSEVAIIPVLPTAIPVISQTPTLESPEVLSTPVPEAISPVFDFVAMGSIPPVGCETEDAIFTNFGWDSDGNVGIDGMAFAEGFSNYAIEIALYDDTNAQPQYDLLAESEQVVNTPDTLAVVNFNPYFSNPGLYRLRLSVFDTESTAIASCEIVIAVDENRSENLPVPLDSRAVTLPATTGLLTDPGNPFQAGDQVDMLVAFFFVDIDEEFQSIITTDSSQAVPNRSTYGFWYLDGTMPELISDAELSPQLVIQRPFTAVEIIRIGNIAPIRIYQEFPPQYVTLAVNAEDLTVIEYYIEAGLPMALIHSVD